MTSYFYASNSKSPLLPSTYNAQGLRARSIIQRFFLNISDYADISRTLL